MTPSPRNHGTARRFVLPVLLLSVVALATLGCNDGDDDGKRGTLAGCVPEGTLLFAAIDTENLATMNAFYEEVVDAEAHARYEREMLALIPELTGLRIDFTGLARAFASGATDWYDGELAVVVGDGVADGLPEAALLVRVSSAERAEEGFPRLLDEVKSAAADVLEDNDELAGYADLVRGFGFDFDTTEFSGTTVHSLRLPGMSNGLHWAARGEALAVGVDLDYVHTCLNGLAAKKVHVRAEDFRAAYREHVEPHPLMWIYLDAETGRGLLREAGEYRELPREVRRELDAVRGVAFSVGADGFELTTGAKAVFDPEALAGTEYLKTALTWKPSVHGLDPYVRRGSAPFAMSMNHVGDITRFVVNKMAESDPYDLVDAREAVREATGHTLDEIVAAVGDEAAFAFHDLDMDVSSLMMGDGNAAGVELIMAVEVDDEPLIRDLLSFAGEALPAATENGVELRTLSDRHYVIEVADAPRQATTILLEDGRLLMAVGRPDFAETGGEPAGDPIPVEGNALFVVDWPALSKLSAGLFDDIEAAPMLKALITATPDNKLMYDRWRFFMTEAVLAYDNTIETVTIEDDALAFRSVHTIDEEGLKTIPYDQLIDVNREQLRELAKMIRRNLR